MNFTILWPKIALLIFAISLSPIAPGRQEERKLATAVTFATAVNTRDALDPLHHTDRSPHATLNGQNVHGTDTVCFNHLGKVIRRSDNHPHAFQALLEAEFEEGNAGEKYVEERVVLPNYLCNSVPLRIDITALALDVTGRVRLGRLSGTTSSSGHFEQAETTPIVEDASARIERVLHFREFEPEVEPPKQPHYLLSDRGEDTLTGSLP